MLNTGRHVVTANDVCFGVVAAVGLGLVDVVATVGGGFVDVVSAVRLDVREETGVGTAVETIKVSVTNENSRIS